MYILRTKILLHICLLAIFSGARAQSPGAYSPCQEMPALMQNFKADNASLTRFYAPASPSFRESAAGGNFRAVTAVSSPETRARMEQLYNSYLQQLSKINFDGLSQECKADYILFKRDLNEKLRLSRLEAEEFSAVKGYFPFADTIYNLQKLRRRGIRPDAERVAANWDRIARQINDLMPRLRQDTSLTVTSIRSAVSSITYLQQCLAGIYTFYNGYDPLFTWWAPKPYEKLNQALTSYADAFRKKQKIDASGIVARKPIGRDEIVRLLKYEMVDYTPEEILDIANKEFAWCDKEMLKASREYGFGDDWKAALEKVKNTYVPAGEQPEAILELYNESVDFLKKHDLVTIPPLAEEVWGMYMMSPERQRTNAFFTGGWDITISYPTNTMAEDDRLMSMRGNNPHFSRATVHHELIAGHNLEFFSNARHRTYRDYDTPFWVEGWSLYWELLLYDMNFAVKPEDKIGMLFWRMHRCARIIFSFNYHMGKWTPQQCIDFLVDRVGHERANAESEIRGPLSGNSNPLYQVGYLTGGFEFYALKKELVDSGKMTYKQFHDAVMQLNCMPVEMIRAILAGKPLTKDYSTSWKFFDKLLPL
ncbi:MAG: DUF885 family protein [Bacteroidetes bacterium]|nr:DUF885 family protein [Bacteroidota bacterium]